jgi:hypothetical protein
MSGQSSSQHGQNRGDSRSRWSASSLRPLRGVVQLRPHCNPARVPGALRMRRSPPPSRLRLIVRRPSEDDARTATKLACLTSGDPRISQMFPSDPGEVLANDTCSHGCQTPRLDLGLSGSLDLLACWRGGGPPATSRARGRTQEPLVPCLTVRRVAPGASPSKISHGCDESAGIAAQTVYAAAASNQHRREGR